jgi:hypothetical protein
MGSTGAGVSIHRSRACLHDALVHRAARPEQLSTRAGVDVVYRIILKVVAREVPSSRFDLSFAGI